MGTSTTAIPEKGHIVVQSSREAAWGRESTASWHHTIGALFLVTASVLLVHLNWTALEYCGGSLMSALQLTCSKSVFQVYSSHFPVPSTAGFLGYVAWIFFQALLYYYLPGKLCFGQRTPGGHLLSYTANGVMAWAVTHILYLATSASGLVDPALIAKHWQGLFVAANVYGFLMAAFAQLKAYVAPSFQEDVKFTGILPQAPIRIVNPADCCQGSWIFDFWAGVSDSIALSNVPITDPSRLSLIQGSASTSI